MTRSTFLQSIIAFAVAPFAKKPESEFERLELDYCRAANALTRYRAKMGFEPGAKVRAQFRNEPPKTGIIRKYGDGWDTLAGHMNVPLRLDNGTRQPWSMGDLTIIEPAPKQQPNL